MATYICSGIWGRISEDGKVSFIFCGKCKSWIHPKRNDSNFIDFQGANGLMTHLYGFVLLTLICSKLLPRGEIV